MKPWFFNERKTAVKETETKEEQKKTEQ